MTHPALRREAGLRIGATGRSFAIAGLSAGVSALSGAVLSGSRARSLAPDGWTRANYRGRQVSLGGGAGAALGASAAACMLPPRERAASLLMIGAGALSGAYDDLGAARREHQGDKGLRGHFAALRAGRPSGGVVKVAVIGAASVAAARITGARGADVALRALAIAGSANAVNLLDLRPGRAAKAVFAVGGPLLLGRYGGAAAAAAGAAAGALPADLCERSMLGDTGANALGGLLGVRLALLPLWARLAAAAAAAGLSVVSERVSFSAVIADTPWLAAADRWGREGP